MNETVNEGTLALYYFGDGLTTAERRDVESRIPLGRRMTEPREIADTVERLHHAGRGFPMDKP